MCDLVPSDHAIADNASLSISSKLKYMFIVASGSEDNDKIKLAYAGHE